MIKRALKVAGLILLVAFLGNACVISVLVFFPYPEGPKPAYPEPWTPRLVIVDPGHGGTNKGTTAASGMPEKVFTLKIAQGLADYLRGTGRCQVLLTRNSDVTVTSLQRIAASPSKAHAFLSIHGNAPPPGARIIRRSGYMVIYARPESRGPVHESRRLALHLGAALRSRGFLPDCSPWEYVPFKNRVLRLSQGLLGYPTAYVTRSLRLGVFDYPRGKITVLDENDQPAVLIETGYLTNPAEEQDMLSAEFRHRFFNAVEQGLLAFFSA